MHKDGEHGTMLRPRENGAIMDPTPMAFASLGLITCSASLLSSKAEHRSRGIGGAAVRPGDWAAARRRSSSARTDRRGAVLLRSKPNAGPSGVAARHVLRHGSPAAVAVARHDGNATRGSAGPRGARARAWWPGDDGVAGAGAQCGEEGEGQLRGSVDEPTRPRSSRTGEATGHRRFGARPGGGAVSHGGSVRMLDDGAAGSSDAGGGAVRGEIGGASRAAKEAAMAPRGGCGLDRCAEGSRSARSQGGTRSRGKKERGDVERLRAWPWRAAAAGVATSGRVLSAGEESERRLWSAHGVRRREKKEGGESSARLGS
ncbi:uncharacterized protein [Miscanthus floridulus]|uniref:uncharacterized protein n=1 Tax=Miscanthus floridulus TaxID=154761 RepID=UPI003458B80B